MASFEELVEVADVPMCPTLLMSILLCQSAIHLSTPHVLSPSLSVLVVAVDCDSLNTHSVRTHFIGCSSSSAELSWVGSHELYCLCG